jgi:hypothetical protein
MFSPDGRWIAYFSTEAGNSTDVYVRPFSGLGGTWRVFTEGGTSPRWSATTHERRLLNLSGRSCFAPYTVVVDSFRRQAAELVADLIFDELRRLAPAKR